MSFSAYGRRSLARASVVVMPSAANRCAAMLAISSLWWAGEPPKRAAFFGRGMASVLDVQGQAPLVELLDHLFERLLPEVRDGEEVLLALLEQLPDRVDLGPLEAVARALRQVELLDREVEVGRVAADLGGVAQLEAPGRVAQLGD